MIRAARRAFSTSSGGIGAPAARRSMPGRPKSKPRPDQRRAQGTKRVTPPPRFPGGGVKPIPDRDASRRARRTRSSSRRGARGGECREGPNGAALASRIEIMWLTPPRRRTARSRRNRIASGRQRRRRPPCGILVLGRRQGERRDQRRRLRARRASDDVRQRRAPSRSASPPTAATIAQLGRAEVMEELREAAGRQGQGRHPRRQSERAEPAEARGGREGRGGEISRASRSSVPSTTPRRRRTPRPRVIRVNNAYPDIKGWAMVGGWALFTKTLLTDIGFQEGEAGRRSDAANSADGATLCRKKRLNSF